MYTLRRCAMALAILCVLTPGVCALNFLTQRCAESTGCINPGTDLSAVSVNKAIYVGWDKIDGTYQSPLRMSFDLGQTWSTFSTNPLPTWSRGGFVRVAGSGVTTMAYLSGVDFANNNAGVNAAAVLDSNQTWVKRSIGSGFAGRLLAAWPVIRGGGVSGRDAVYIMGGISPNQTSMQDVWRLDIDPTAGSAAIPTTRLPDAPWRPRYAMGYAVVDANGDGGARIVIAGGVSRSSSGVRQSLSDVWISDTLVQNWVQLTAAAPWGPRSSFSLLNIAGNLIFTGGDNYGVAAHKDAWISSDSGNSWMLLTNDANYTARLAAPAVAVDRSFVMMGGLNGIGVPLTSVWYSYV